MSLGVKARRTHYRFLSIVEGSLSIPSFRRILWVCLVVGQFWGPSYAQCGSVEGSTVPLYWDANNEPNIDYYNVYRSPTSGSGYSVIGTVPQSPNPTISYTDPTPLSTGYYVVTAVDTSVLESGFSDELCVALAEAPPPPTSGGGGGGGGGAPAPTGSDTILVAHFTNGNDEFFESRVYLWNPSTSLGHVTVRVFTLPHTGDSFLLGEVDLGILEASSAHSIRLAEDILTPLGITQAYTEDAGNLTLEFTIEAPNVQGDVQVFSSSHAFGTYPLQEILPASNINPTVLVANFMNGNTEYFESRVYLWNPSTSAGEVRVRLFTLPHTGDSFLLGEVNLGILEGSSARNIKLEEDILMPLGIPLPYTEDAGNLTLELTIEAPNVRGAGQVFSSSRAFGTYPLQEILPASNVNPTTLVANFMNGNTEYFESRVYLWNPSTSAGEVRVRVFTLPHTGDSFLLGEVNLGILEGSSARNIKLAEDILMPLGIPLPYTEDAGNLTLEFTIEAPNVRGAGQVFSSSHAFGTYLLREILPTSNVNPTVLVADFMNGNTEYFESRVYLWNPSTSAGEVRVRVFTLTDTGDSFLLGEVNLGILEGSSARNIKLAEDILVPLEIPLPYMEDDGNLTVEFTIGAPNVQGAAQVFSSDLAFGTYPLR